MKKVLFIGNFLSKHRGTKNPIEILSDRIEKEGFIVYRSSSFENKMLRLMAMIIKSAFCPYQTIQIDVFSGPAFRFARLMTFIAYLRRKKIVLMLLGGALPEFFSKNSESITRTFNKATIINTHSVYLKQFFENKGFRIKYVPYGLDLEKFPFSKPSFGGHNLLWVRAFTEIYNPDLAIRTLKVLKDDFPDVSLTMVGPDRGLLNSARSLAKELNVSESVSFVGMVPNDQLYKYYQTHSVYLNTTSYESFGMALFEAASCGCPVVTTSVGEVPLLWEDGENILLVKTFDEVVFANAIKKYFSDSNLCETVAGKAREKSESFDWEYLKSKWIELLS